MAEGAEVTRHHDRFERTGRFEELQDAARTIITRLGEGYVVERTDGVNLDAYTAIEWPGARTTRLSPPPGAAAIAFLFGSGSLPGVDLHYGFAGRSLFPGCFCDECAESVEENIQRMTAVVDSVVAGHLSETRTRRLLRHDLYTSLRTGQDCSEGREDRLDPTLRDVMPRGTVRWKPWKPLVPAVP